MSAPDLATVQWVKSSYSNNNGTCVEVAFVPGGVAARDSKDPEGGALAFSAAAFGSFLRVIAQRSPE
ncbi:DUF397 domain-containing protein [Amycolatopsis samaneae]|uniref:DUF397 domain-containing protein n=1 Tax=Amycolatopsis samaneae TaxID=664691 RepID=A0ABW5GV12_9PSEU